MFDPTYPPTNALIESAPLRAQFNSLKALIDAMASVNAAVVDDVTTLPPGDPAAVSLNVVANTLHFTFGIPQGNDGQQGSQGLPGNDGQQGPQGPQGSDGTPGPPFAQAVVDGVNTLPPGSNATVSVNFDGSNVRFTFSIPSGFDGAAGQPGEVSLADLNAALLTNLGQCSNNSNGVGNLSMNADPNYDQNQMQAVMQKLDELINALRR
jgi:hypothetical protein